MGFKQFENLLPRKLGQALLDCVVQPAAEPLSWQVPIRAAITAVPPCGGHTAFQHHPCDSVALFDGYFDVPRYAPAFLLSFFTSNLRFSETEACVKNIIYVKKPVATATQQSACCLV